MGNASLEGAVLVALDPAMLALAVETARAAVHVDLVLHTGFARALVDATRFEAYGI